MSTPTFPRPALPVIPVLPTGPVAAAALEYLRAAVSQPVAHHSVRSYLFARLLADHEELTPGADYDDDLLFHACVLHDLGTSPESPGQARFELEGADLAAAFLTRHGYPVAAVDQVWQAIALHSSAQIADRSGTLARLTRRGVTSDFGIDTAHLTDAHGEAVHRDHPRLDMTTALVDAITTHAARSPQAAARYTLAGELTRERGESGVTGLELGTAAGRWGR
ncbi:HD domain-containing protein [Kitasatospora sp. NA04385]|uniref:HD domain-containing protein n=1 Tax=Kitasatospora sp. NA04385 TaxID=2742135 RepID=UPI00159219FD|nr:HD domain-containing protein [Kitasatospora sp. NA04385]QKW22852.1 HD domain-containing protein [Kitasatospora sp. NA04385]